MLSSGQNVYVAYTTELLKNDQDLHYFLTYLKLRVYSRNRYGSFTISDEVCKFLGLRRKTFIKHLTYGLLHGWFRWMDNNTEVYHIISFAKIAHDETTKRATVARLDDELLSAITWKNIADLKALFQEYANQRFTNYKNYVARKQKQQKEWSNRDHSYISQKQDNQNERNGQIKGGPITPFACSLASSISNKSSATTHRYRYKDSVRGMIRYTNTKRKISNLFDGCSEIVTEWNQHKEIALFYLVSPQLPEEEKKRLTIEIRYGRFILCKDGIYLRAAGDRCGTIELRRVKVKAEQKRK